MQRSAVTAMGLAALLLGATRAVYPTYASQGRSYPNNTLPPRKDKGSRYVWNGRTRSIAA